MLDGNQITVDVKDGVAILRVSVDSWKDSDAPTENAYEGGAKEVRDYLNFRINPQEDTS